MRGLGRSFETRGSQIQILSPLLRSRPRCAGLRDRLDFWARPSGPGPLDRIIEAREESAGTCQLLVAAGWYASLCDIPAPKLPEFLARMPQPFPDGRSHYRV